MHMARWFSMICCSIAPQDSAEFATDYQVARTSPPPSATPHSPRRPLARRAVRPTVGSRSSGIDGGAPTRIIRGRHGEGANTATEGGLIEAEEEQPLRSSLVRKEIMEGGREG